jgi:hypothetical protein
VESFLFEFSLQSEFDLVFSLQAPGPTGRCGDISYNPIRFLLFTSTAGKRKMVDVESADHEQRVQSELDPLIQHIPSVQEANVARAQFLALCWSMFVMGWTNSSSGPLLPRIQVFYGVSR